MIYRTCQRRCEIQLTFKVVYTIKEVPDSFTGIVCAHAAGDLHLQLFNAPRGNVRKIIILKKQVASGGA